MPRGKSSTKVKDLCPNILTTSKGYQCKNRQGENYDFPCIASNQTKCQYSGVIKHEKNTIKPSIKEKTTGNTERKTNTSTTYGKVRRKM
jgi:hypothetical protein